MPLEEDHDTFLEEQKSGDITIVILNKRWKLDKAILIKQV